MVSVMLKNYPWRAPGRAWICDGRNCVCIQIIHIVQKKIINLYFDHPGMIMHVSDSAIPITLRKKNKKKNNKNNTEAKTKTCRSKCGLVKLTDQSKTFVVWIMRLGWEEYAICARNKSIITCPNTTAWVPVTTALKSDKDWLSSVWLGATSSEWQRQVSLV